MSVNADAKNFWNGQPNHLPRPFISGCSRRKGAIKNSQNHFHPHFLPSHPSCAFTRIWSLFIQHFISPNRFQSEFASSSFSTLAHACLGGAILLVPFRLEVGPSSTQPRKNHFNPTQNMQKKTNIQYIFYSRFCSLAL